MAAARVEGGLAVGARAHTLPLPKYGASVVCLAYSDGMAARSVTVGAPHTRQRSMEVEVDGVASTFCKDANVCGAPGCIFLGPRHRHAALLG